MKWGFVGSSNFEGWDALGVRRTKKNDSEGKKVPKGTRDVRICRNILFSENGQRTYWSSRKHPVKIKQNQKNLIFFQKQYIP